MTTKTALLLCLIGIYSSSANQNLLSLFYAFFNEFLFYAVFNASLGYLDCPYF